MDNIIFVNNIKELRCKRDMKQETLAALVGVSKNMIIKYEKQQAQPSLENVLRLMYVLNVTFNEIVYVASIGKRRDIFEPGTILEITENLDAIYESVIVENKDIVLRMFERTQDFGLVVFREQFDEDWDAFLADWGAWKILNCCGAEKDVKYSEDECLGWLDVSIDLIPIRYDLDLYSEPAPYLIIRNMLKQKLVSMWNMTEDEALGFEIDYATRDVIVIRPFQTFNCNILKSEIEECKSSVEKECEAFKSWVKRSNIGRLMRKVFRNIK